MHKQDGYDYRLISTFECSTETTRVQQKRITELEELLWTWPVMSQLH